LLIAPYFLDEEDLRRTRTIAPNVDEDDDEIDFAPPAHIKQRQAKHVYGTLQAKFKKDQ